MSCFRPPWLFQKLLFKLLCRLGERRQVLALLIFAFLNFSTIPVQEHPELLPEFSIGIAISVVISGFLMLVRIRRHRFIVGILCIYIFYCLLLVLGGTLSFFSFTEFKSYRIVLTSFFPLAITCIKQFSEMKFQVFLTVFFLIKISFILY